MKFNVDAHRPPGLCALFHAAGRDAIHTTWSTARNQTTDGVINDLSDAEQPGVFSKDTDFYYSHVLHQRPWRLLLVRTGSIRVRELKELFRCQLPVIIQALEVNSLVELDRISVQVDK